MKNECKIIGDILPLYAEKMVSAETGSFVEEHLAGCEDCQKIYKNMKEPPELSPVFGAVPLRRIKKGLLRKRAAAILFTGVTVLAAAITVFAYLTAPQYLPYSDGLLSVETMSDGTVICVFDGGVTGCSVFENIGAYMGNARAAFHISAWTSVWDKRSEKRGEQNIILHPADGIPFAVYYNQNNGMEDVWVYGTFHDANSGVTTLPRLVLAYNLTAALAACAVLAAPLLIFRKKPAARLWLERVFLFPAAYIIGHLCVVGFPASSYNAERDFALILLVTIPVYLACLLGMYLYRAKKEGQNV